MSQELYMYIFTHLFVFAIFSFANIDYNDDLQTIYEFLINDALICDVLISLNPCSV